MASQTNIRSVCAIKKAEGSSPQSYVKVLYVHAQTDYMHIFSPAPPAVCDVVKGLEKGVAQKCRHRNTLMFRGAECNHTAVHTADYYRPAANDSFHYHLLAHRAGIQQHFIKPEFKINHPANEDYIIIFINFYSNYLSFLFTFSLSSPITSVKATVSVEELFVGLLNESCAVFLKTLAGNPCDYHHTSCVHKDWLFTERLGHVPHACTHTPKVHLKHFQCGNGVFLDAEKKNWDCDREREREKVCVKERERNSSLQPPAFSRTPQRSGRPAHS